MSEVRDALLDLQVEVNNSWSSISRAFGVLQSAMYELTNKQDELKNSYENVAKIEQFTAQVRHTVASYTDGIYRAARSTEDMW